MARRIAVLCLGFLLVVSTAHAQMIEASASIGYTSSEGVTSDERPLLGALYDTLSIKSGSSFNFTFGVFVNDNAEIEFLFARQNSELTAEGPGVETPVSELTVFNYHGNFVYNWGERDAMVRPFFFGGLGVTNYSFGDLLLPPIPTPRADDQINSETRFSSTWGGGVKLYFSPTVGARVTGRWTPTYITSDPEGVWCDPWYGCWQLVDAKYANQFEFSGGVTVRF